MILEVMDRLMEVSGRWTRVHALILAATVTGGSTFALYQDNAIVRDNIAWSPPTGSIVGEEALSLEMLDLADQEMDRADLILRNLQDLTDQAIDTYLEVLDGALDACEKDESPTRWSRLTAALVMARNNLSESIAHPEIWLAVFTPEKGRVSLPERFWGTPVRVAQATPQLTQLLRTLDDLDAQEV